MIERETYPPGVPCWIDTMQPDPDAALAFYGALFGWEFENRAPAGAPGPYYVARLHGFDVAGVGGPLPGTDPSWKPYTAVESIERTVERVRRAGGKVIVEPTDVPGQGRLAEFADREGAVFLAWEPHGFIGAQLVNEFGAWNFSELYTRDPSAAKQFYDAVFDWDVVELGLGDNAFTFFTVSGYGDFLEKLQPGMREAQSEQGVSDGFADAVAWLIPTDEPNARWGVTIAVDDADAIATRAQELGGEVLTPPFDAPPVRMTVLRDPQGAVFTASKYQPDA